MCPEKWKVTRKELDYRNGENRNQSQKKCQKEVAPLQFEAEKQDAEKHCQGNKTQNNREYERHNQNIHQKAKIRNYWGFYAIIKTWITNRLFF